MAPIYGKTYGCFRHRFTAHPPTAKRPGHGGRDRPISARGPDTGQATSQIFGDRLDNGNEAQGAELVFHPGVVRAVQFPAAAVEHVPGQVVAAFLQVAHPFQLAAVVGVVGEGQHVQGLEDPPYAAIASLS